MTACKSTALGGIWSDREVQEVRNDKEGDDQQGKGSEVKKRGSAWRKQRKWSLLSWEIMSKHSLTDCTINFTHLSQSAD